MAKEHTIKLHSDSMDAGPEEEYEHFRDLESAINRDGFSKAYVEVIPQNGPQDVEGMARDIRNRFNLYSVQIFVRDKGGGNYMILVIARKKDANIADKMQHQLQNYVHDNFMHQGAVKSVDSRTVRPSEF